MSDIAKTPKLDRLKDALLVLVFVPILGVLLGGVYSLPAMKLTKARDPSLTLLLSMGLGISVFGIGTLFHTPLAYLALVWAFTLVLLVLARWAYGGLGRSLEPFGFVHMAALTIVALVSVAVHARARSANQVP